MGRKKKVILNTLKQKDILQRVDSLSNTLSDEYTKKSKSWEYLGKGKRETKRERDYQVIYEILTRQFGTSPISKTTIWRILKIKEKDLNLYKEVISGNKPIKETYNLLYDKEKSDVKIETVVETKTLYDFTKDEVNFDEVLEFLNKLRTQLEEKCNANSQKYSKKKLDDIDTQLFKLRKCVMKLITYSDEWYQN